MAEIKTEKKIKILVVDDDAEIVDTIALAFTGFGHEAYKAHSGNEAWRVTQKVNVDLVVSDIRMPDGTGLEFLDQLKKHDVQTPKVLFITGFSDITLDTIYHLGADGLLGKPFRLETIKQTIEEMAMPLQQRWQKRQYVTRGTLEKSIRRLQTVFDTGDISIGRGGFFWECEPFDLEGLVQFRLHIADGLPCPVLSGVGLVKWSRPEPLEDLPSGLGLEIKCLNDDCREPFIKWLERLTVRSYIPRK